MTHSEVCHDSFICVSVYECTRRTPREPLQFSMTQSYVCHDSFVCVPRPTHVRHNSSIPVPWHDLMRLYVLIDHSQSTWTVAILNYSFICVPWLIHMCSMTHSHVSLYESTSQNPREPLEFSVMRSYVCHDSFIFVPWLIHMCLYLLIHQSQSPNPETQFLGTNSNRTKISFWISTMRYRGIWVTRFGRFRGCYIFRGNCHHARKAAWNPAGVEPIYWKPADINPGSLKWVQLGNAL